MREMRDRIRGRVLARPGSRDLNAHKQWDSYGNLVIGVVSVAVAPIVTSTTAGF